MISKHMESVAIATKALRTMAGGSDTKARFGETYRAARREAAKERYRAVRRAGWTTTEAMRTPSAESIWRRALAYDLDPGRGDAGPRLVEMGGEKFLTIPPNGVFGDDVLQGEIVPEIDLWRLQPIAVHPPIIQGDALLNDPAILPRKPMTGQEIMTKTRAIVDAVRATVEAEDVLVSVPLDVVVTELVTPFDERLLQKDGALMAYSADATAFSKEVKT